MNTLLHAPKSPPDIFLSRYEVKIIRTRHYHLRPFPPCGGRTGWGGSMLKQNE